MFIGEVQEWLNWLVSKTSEPLPVPRVRIPLSPPLKSYFLITSNLAIAQPRYHYRRYTTHAFRCTLYVVEKCSMCQKI